MNAEDTRIHSTAVAVEAFCLAAADGPLAYNQQTGFDWNGLVSPTKVIEVTPDFQEVDHSGTAILTMLQDGVLHQYRVQLSVTDLGTITFDQLKAQYVERGWSDTQAYLGVQRAAVPDDIAAHL